ncbi:hypothetical protein Bbelb_027200 [Branchiostoma belcheri]|nr:hypothetical protein Bbelb_027200 [Branchiostoma belcheri]
METKTRAVGHGDGGKERSSVRQERPGIWSVLASWLAEPVGVEVDLTKDIILSLITPRVMVTTVYQITDATGRSDDGRDSVATPREATVAHQGEGDVKGTAGHSRGRAVRRVARSSRKVKRSASEKTTAGASMTRRKRQKRKADVSDEVEGDCRPQPKRKAPAGPPPVALIYRDVVAGERVLVNYIPDDPCPWESPDGKKLSAYPKSLCTMGGDAHFGLCIEAGDARHVQPSGPAETSRPDDDVDVDLKFLCFASSLSLISYRLLSADQSEESSTEPQQPIQTETGGMSLPVPSNPRRHVVYVKSGLSSGDEVFLFVVEGCHDANRQTTILQAKMSDCQRIASEGTSHLVFATLSLTTPTNLQTKCSGKLKGVTPSDVTFCSSYRQDFHTRTLLSQVASELTMWLDNQERVLSNAKDTGDDTCRFSNPKATGDDTCRFSNPKATGDDTCRFSNPKDTGDDTCRFSNPKDTGDDTCRFSNPKDTGDDTCRLNFSNPKATGDDTCRFSNPKDTGDDTCRFSNPKDTGDDTCRFSNPKAIDDDTCSFSSRTATGDDTCRFSNPRDTGDDTCRFSNPKDTGDDTCRFSNPKAIDDDTCSFSSPTATGDDACGFSNPKAIDDDTCSFSSPKATGDDTCRFSYPRATGDDTCRFSNPKATGDDTCRFSNPKDTGDDIHFCPGSGPQLAPNGTSCDQSRPKE